MLRRLLCARTVSCANARELAGRHTRAVADKHGVLTRTQHNLAALIFASVGALVVYLTIGFGTLQAVVTSLVVLAPTACVAAVVGGALMPSPSLPKLPPAPAPPYPVSGAKGGEHCDAGLHS